MGVFLVLATAILVLGVLLLAALKRYEHRFGVLASPHAYADTSAKPGETLYAKTLPLAGKPDYLIVRGGEIVPVEVKTGRTPAHPFVNHRLQLAAYCLLVQERYGSRPSEGYLVYPDVEFRITYTPELEAQVRQTVRDILRHKRDGKELRCSHPEHNF